MSAEISAAKAPDTGSQPPAETTDKTKHASDKQETKDKPSAEVTVSNHKHSNSSSKDREASASTDKSSTAGASSTKPTTTSTANTQAGEDDEDEDGAAEEEEEGEDEYEEDDDTDHWSMSNPSRFWNRIEAGLRRANDPRIFVEYGINAINKCLKNEFNEDQETYLVKSGIHSCLVSILTRDDFPVESRIHVNDFIQSCIELCVNKLTHPAWTHLVQTLFRIFFHHEKHSCFYVKVSKEGINEEQKKKFYPESDEDKALHYLTMPKGDKTTSPYYVINGNYFGSLGGFEALLSKMAQCTDSIFYTKLIVKVPFALREFLSTSFTRVFTPRLMKASFDTMLEFSGRNLRAEEKTHFEELRDLFLFKLLELVMTEDQVNEQLVGFQLESCKNQFFTDKLDRRLRGMRDLKRIIERTRKEEKKFSTAISNFLRGKEEEKKEESRVDPKFVLNWLVTHDIVDRFFIMTQSHVEILRQGADLLIFLAQQKSFTTKHIDLLWEMSIGMHEHDKRVLYTVLSNVANYLNVEQLNHLISKVHSLPVRDYDVQALELVFGLTKYAIKANSQLKWNGLELLWNVIQDGSGVVLSAAAKAFNQLWTLLEFAECQTQREPYLEKCIEKVAAGESVPQCLQLAQRIINSFPLKRRKKAVEQLDQKFKLLDVFLKELAEYKKVAQKAAQQLQQGGAAAASSDAPVDKKDKRKKTSKKKSKDQLPAIPENGVAKPPAQETAAAADVNEMTIGKTKKSHLENIKLRLDFLEYILVNSALVMSPSVVDSLWDCLISQALSPEERELAFTWLQKTNLNQDGYPVIPESVLQHIFTSKMLKMDATQLTPAGYRLFERLFLYINEKNAKIKKYEEKIAQPAPTAEAPAPTAQANGQTTASAAAAAPEVEIKYVAIASDLLGVNNLWDAALGCPDAVVSDAAIEFLNSLHQNLEIVNAKRAPKLLEEFIKSAMERIAAAVSDKASTGQRVARCVLLLRTVIHDFDARPEAIRIRKLTSNVATKDSTAVQLKLWLKSPGKPSQRMLFSSSTTVGVVKEKACEVFGFDPYDTLRLLADDDKDKDLKDVEKTLGFYRISEESSIVVKKVDELKIEGDLPLSGLMLDSLFLCLNGLGLTTDSLRQAIRKTDTDKALKSTASVLKGLATSASSKKDGHPAKILTTPAYFDKIYELLTQESAPAAKQVWELLMLLPRSDQFTKQAESMASEKEGSKALEQFVDKHHPYKLIYNLQSIDALATADAPAQPSASSTGSSAVDWREKLASSGLLSQLVKHFLSLENVAKSEASKKVFSHLLHTINLIALEKASTSEDAASAVPAPAESRSTSAFKLRKKSIDADVLPKLLPKLMDIIRAAADESELAEGANATPEVINEALQLLSAILVSSNPCLQAFIKREDLPNWLVALVLKAHHHFTREFGAKGLSSLAQRIAENSKLAQSLPSAPPTFFLNLLLPALTEVELFSETCDQYFMLLEALLKEYDNSKELLTLVKRLSRAIVKHPVVETHATSGPEDKVLIGLMQLVLVILKRDSSFKSESVVQSLVLELFDKCLFAIPTANDHGLLAPPKCKSKAARSTAYKLLVEIAKDNAANMKKLVDLLFVQLDSIDMGTDFSFSSSSKEKSIVGYLGLQNQGATCYMNSLVQQMFMIPEFRQGILVAEENKAVTSALEALMPKPKKDNSKEKLTDKDKDSKDKEDEEEEKDDNVDNVLYQMQRMFAFLQESDKRYFDTIDFCSSYKDFDGRPVNVSQQMDANEFFNRLFDNLERKLKGSKQEEILKRIFGGTLCHQIIPTECTHRRERPEPFYSISVEVKNKNSLADALQLFIEGEMLSGDNKYNCETCNKPVDTLKRCVVDTLPPVLVIHLKRFEYDYENNRNAKLNTSVSFPPTLNLEAYTKEGIAKREAERGGANGAPVEFDESQMHPSWYYDYELAGIVVHQGAADFGHYYSYIRERVPLQGKERRWFEFNDTHVMPFDPSQIPRECFGGEDDYTEWADLARTQRRTVKRPRSNNAYILVYERKTNSSSPLLDPTMLPNGSGSQWEQEALKRNDLRRSKTHRRTLSADESSTNTATAASATAAVQTPPVAPAPAAEENEDDKLTPEERDKRERRRRLIRSSSDPEKLMSPEERAQLAATADKQAAAAASVAVEKIEEAELPKKGLDKSLRRSTKQTPVSAENTSPTKSTDAKSPSFKPEEEAPALTITPLTGSKKVNTADTSSGNVFLPERRKKRKSIVSGTEETLSNSESSLPDAKSVASATAASPEDDAPVSPTKSTSIVDLNDPILTSRQKPRVTVPKTLLTEIWNENSEFLVRKHLFDSEYFNFMWSIVNSAPSQRKAKPEKSKAAQDLEKLREKERQRQRQAPVLQFYGIPQEVDKERAQAMLLQQAPPGTASSSSGSGGVGGFFSGLTSGKSKDSKAKADAKKVGVAPDAKKTGSADKLIDQDFVIIDKENADKEKEKEKAAAAEKEKLAAAEKEKQKKAKEGGSDDEKSGGKAKNSLSTPGGAKSIDQDSSDSSEHKKKRKAEKDTTLSIAQLSLKFIVQVFSHAREKPLFTYWINTVRRLLEHSVEASHWFLGLMVIDTELLKATLISCPVERMRHAYAQLMVAAVQCLAPEEQSQYSATRKLIAENPNGVTDPPPSYTIWFIEKLFTLLKTAKRKNSDQFFYIFSEFAKISPRERKYLVNRGAMQTFAEFSKALTERSILAATNYNPGQLKNFLECLCTVLLTCSVEPDQEGFEDLNPPTLLSEAPISWPESEYDAALNKHFLYTMLREDVNTQALCRIAYHFCWNNLAMTKFFMRIVAEGLVKVNMSAFNGFLNLFVELLNLDDSLTERRIEIGIDVFIEGINANMRTKRAVEKCLQVLVKLAGANEQVRKKVYKFKAKLNHSLEIVELSITAALNQKESPRPYVQK